MQLSSQHILTVGLYFPWVSFVHILTQAIQWISPYHTGHPALAGILLYPFHMGWLDLGISPCHSGWLAHVRIVNIKDYTYWGLNPHTDDHS